MQILQKSAAFDMPLAVARPLTAQLQVSLPYDYKIMWFRLQPSALFLDLRPVGIQFPDFDAIAWGRGDLRTMFRGSLRQKGRSDAAY